MKLKTLSNQTWLYCSLYIWILGIIGVVAFMPSFIKVLDFFPMQSRAEMPIPTLLATFGVPPWFLLAIVTMIGSLSSAKVGLKSPVFEVLIQHNKKEKLTSIWRVLKKQMILGLLFGFAAVLLVWLLSASLMEYLFSVHLLSRILFGSLTEEVLFRWFLMSFLVWLFWRVFQKGQGEVKTHWFWSAIFLTGFIFAFLHWPVLALTLIDPIFVAVVLFFVALPWGWLFWRYGFEAAILAHLMFHLGIEGIFFLSPFPLASF